MATNTPIDISVATQERKQSNPVLGAPVHIETNGFVLRSVQPMDVTPHVLNWICSEPMRLGLNLPKLDFSIDTLRAYLASFDNMRQYFIGIFDRENGLMVGFYTLDVNQVHRFANITTGIGEREYLGKALLWKTIDALLDHFFTYRDIDKVGARILAKNYGMLFNFRDNPRFVLEGVLRSECVVQDGSRQDVVVFAAFRETGRT